MYICCLLLVLSTPIFSQNEQEAIPVDSAYQELQELDESYTEDEEPYYDDDLYERQPYNPPPVSHVEKREIRNEQWSKASGKLDYSDDVPQEKKKEETAPDFSGVNWNDSTRFWGELLQVLAIIIGIAGIAFAIYKTLQAPRNKKIIRAEDGTIITSENVDEYIHETDLERFLREAKAAENYPQCIRLYYLQIIKKLSESGAIKWSKEKTNRDYLREMRTHAHNAAFRDCTRTFEKAWYGNEEMDKSTFLNLEPGFTSFLSLL
ncbi:MAG: DUF4129 domain-containing protein [Saprospiraceae bacterium]